MNSDPFNPPGIVRPAEDLAALAAAANAAHVAGQAASRKSLEHFRAAGEALIKAKKRCGHGNWLAWLEANVEFDRRTASSYTRIATNWETVSHSEGLRDALRILTESAVETEPPPTEIPGQGESEQDGKPEGKDAKPSSAVPKTPSPAPKTPSPAPKPKPAPKTPKPKPASGPTPTPPRPVPPPAPRPPCHYPGENNDWLLRQLSELGSGDCDSCEKIKHELMARLAEPPAEWPDELADPDDPDEPDAWDWESLEERVHDEVEEVFDELDAFKEELKDILWVLENTDPRYNSPEKIKQFLAKYRPKG
jgi:hypothetical protein